MLSVTEGRGVLGLMENEEQVRPMELPGCGQVSRLSMFKVARSYKNIAFTRYL